MTFNSCFYSTLPKQGSKESSLCLSVQTFVSKYFHMNWYVSFKVLRDFLLNSMQESSIMICIMLSGYLRQRRQSQNHTQLQTPLQSKTTTYSKWKHCLRFTDGRGDAPLDGGELRQCILHRNHSYTHYTMRGRQLNEHAKKHYTPTYHTLESMPRCGYPRKEEDRFF